IQQQISAGYDHTCEVLSDGTVVCWGRNDYGQATPPGGTFSAVSVGYQHTCGLRPDGTIACWGRNDYGQASPPGGSFTAVSAGQWHTCGLHPDGTISCWGLNDYGQAPQLTLTPGSLPGGTAGAAYSQVLSATGGLAPYTFTVV